MAACVLCRTGKWWWKSHEWLAQASLWDPSLNPWDLVWLTSLLGRQEEDWYSPLPCCFQQYLLHLGHFKLLPSASMVYLCPNNSNLYKAGSTNSNKVHGGFAASMLLQTTSCIDLQCCNPLITKTRRGKYINALATALWTQVGMKKNQPETILHNFCPFSWSRRHFG